MDTYQRKIIAVKPTSHGLYCQLWTVLIRSITAIHVFIYVNQMNDDKFGILFIITYARRVYKLFRALLFFIGICRGMNENGSVNMMPIY